MKASTATFRGMAPRITARALPDNASQEAINSRLVTGALKAWNRPALTHELPGGAVYRSIFKLNDIWLAWTEFVDVARGTILGDTTFRAFITGPDVYAQPRFTNYALATSGPEPYPFATRPLGVPSPDTAPTLEIGVDNTPTTFSVDVLDEGDALTSSWATSPNVSIPFHTGRVLQSATEGNPLPSYVLEFDENEPTPLCYMYRNFGIGNAAIVHASHDFMCDFTSAVFPEGGPSRQTRMTIQATQGGSGAQAMVISVGATAKLSIGISTGWGQNTAPLLEVDIPGGIVNGDWYTLDMISVLNADGTNTITATLYEGSAQLATCAVTNVFGKGDFVGFMGRTGNDAQGGDEVFQTFVDNVHVQASGATGYTPISLATSYVYTFVNDLGQESAPSPASLTIQRPDGISVTVTTPTTIPTGISDDYGIVTKRIYRAVTGSLGSEFRFVVEQDVGVAEYVDLLTDAELGEVLETTDWDLPPDDMRFILALPNGIMVGAAGNQLCFSAQNRPHAWPISYRLATDTEITGLGNVDTTVFIGTKSFVYTASGNDPSSYSMSKPGAPHACAQHRSIAYLLRIGVVFAGPDGLMASNGPTDVVNLTETIFTRDQWQALLPETILGIAHDDIYFFFAGDPEGSEPKKAYALDMKPTGFGLIELSLHACAVATDFERDALIMVLDEYEEPSTELLPPESGIAVTADGATLYEWDAGTDLMRYSWTGKLWLVPFPGAFAWVRVRAADYVELQIEFSVDGVPFYTRLVTSDLAFRIPVRSTYNIIDWRVIGISTVRTVELADDVSELV